MCWCMEEKETLCKAGFVMCSICIRAYGTCAHVLDSCLHVISLTDKFK